MRCVCPRAQTERGAFGAQGDAAAGWAARRLVVAEALIPALEAKLGAALRPLGALTGGQLAGSRYAHPLMGREGPVVVGGDYITTESGTGLVHTAPGHGQEDYLVGLRCGLGLLSPVDDAGVFTAEAGPFAGARPAGVRSPAAAGLRPLTRRGAQGWPCSRRALRR